MGHRFGFELHLEQHVANAGGVGRVIAELLLGGLHPVPGSAGDFWIAGILVCRDEQPPPGVATGPFSRKFKEMLGCRFAIFGLAVIDGRFEPPPGGQVFLREALGKLGIDADVFAPLVGGGVVPVVIGLGLQHAASGGVAEFVEARRLQ